MFVLCRLWEMLLEWYDRYGTGLLSLRGTSPVSTIFTNRLLTIIVGDLLSLI